MSGIPDSASLAGRLPVCDIPQEHASLSRYHAVIQFSSDGPLFLIFLSFSSLSLFPCSGAPFLYDLGSTHGTFLNKRQLQPRSFLRLFSSDSIRFGASQRLFVVQAPPETVTREDDERAQRMQAKIDKLRGDPDTPSDTADTADSGISWGMADDAPVEEDAQIELSDAPVEGIDDEDSTFFRFHI